MTEFFIAFRSRSEATRYHELLSDYRIPARLINTPSSASVGCGLSVKIATNNMQQALIVLERGKFNSVIGKFYLSNGGRAIRF